MDINQEQMYCFIVAIHFRQKTLQIERTTSIDPEAPYFYIIFYFIE